MSTSIEILKKYWGYEQFRHPQEEIIASILEGKDTFALLPTGGGKSLCYQVPALMKPGICLVISPLIALMQDQVDQLEKRGIKAAFISSHLSRSGIDRMLDNACYDSKLKFLYVSPERLRTRIFQLRLENMPINLIAVDEAHCISEWGHDFRPDYRLIQDIRKVKSETPMVALTATATQEVVEDISEQLQLRNPEIFKKSFQRDNLYIQIEKTENKLTRLRELLNQNKGSGIVYCSTRKNVKSLYNLLISEGLSVDFYHGGLNFNERKAKQNSWISNETQTIICTNAFGMGIDKADVRFVIHYDLPESPEAYFQEIGRAGRDGEDSMVLALFEDGDLKKMDERHRLKFPALSEIRQVYKALGNYFQLPIGSGKEEKFSLNLPEFCKRYELGVLHVHNSLRILELAGFIKYLDQNERSARIHFTANKQQLYSAQLKDEQLNRLIQQILRTHIGVLDDFVNFNDYEVRTRLGLDSKMFNQLIDRLGKLELAQIEGRSSEPRILYLTERLEEQNLSIPPEILKKREATSRVKLDSIQLLAKTKSCYQSSLLAYFGEDKTQDCLNCGNCDSQRMEVSPKDLKKSILSLLKDKPEWSISELIAALSNFDREFILEELRSLSDNQLLTVSHDGNMITLN